MNKENINNAVKPVFLISLLIIAFSVLFNLVIFPYLSRKNLGACLLKAKEVYNEKWTTTCLSLYSEEVIKEHTYDERCGGMAALYADPIQKEYQEQKDDCLSRYPQ